MNIKVKTFSTLLLLICCFSVSSQENKNAFPYKLSFNNEVLIISSGLILNSTYDILNESNYVRTLNENELNKLNKNEINNFDRSAAEYWSPKYSDYSDYLRNTLRYSPALFAIPYIKDKAWNKIITLGLIYAEGYYLTAGVTRSTKILVQRKRPYLYNTSTISYTEKLDLSNENNSYYSFFSGHASAAFYSATFISKVYYDIFGADKWFYILSAFSYTTASSVAYFRVKAGEHYPSDVLIGALVGTATGYLMPQVHKKQDPKLLVFGYSNSIGIIYKF